MSKKVNILFTATFSTPFIQEDLKILSTHFHVVTIISSGIATLLKYIFTVQSMDVTFSWFGSVYSSILIFFVKIFGKKSILILGGVDVAKIPELNYGIWNSWWKSIIVRYGIKNADIVLAVHESLKNDAMRLARYDGKNIFVLSTGYDPDRWTPGGRQNNIVLTVAVCEDMKRAKIKGIDFLSEVAKTMPDTPFVLIGINCEIALQLQLPSNIKHQEFVEQSELLEMYRRAKVFFQPSMREGLPNTLCEAMLCGCLPVGTNIGGIPSIIDETGFIVEYPDVVGAVQALRKALESSVQSKPRERIIQLYNITSREESLKLYISSLVNEK